MVNNNIVRPGKWELTCITYKLMGEPKPLEVIDGVLVKDRREQRKVEEYLKELYEFGSEGDYQDFLRSFIVRDSRRGIKPNSQIRQGRREKCLKRNG